MSSSEKISQSIAAKQGETGLRIKLVIAAIVVLVGYSLYQGSNDLHSGLVEAAQQALDQAGVDHKTIKLRLDGRHALLSGHAPDQASADRAFTTLSQTPGIRSVEQRIVVSKKTGDSLAATSTAKATASAPSPATPAETHKIVSVAEDKVPHIRAQWQGGKLTLSGVLSSKELAQLLSAARNAYSPDQLENQIRVQSGLPEASWLPSFTRHLGTLKQQQTASIESSANQLLPKQPDQTLYLLGNKNTANKSKPAANALTLNTQQNNALLPTKPARKTRATVKPKTPTAKPKPAITPAKKVAAASPTNSGPVLRLRSHLGRAAISGTLSSRREFDDLSHALLLAYPPALTLNQVQITPSAKLAPWLAGINTTWALSQQIEWLDLSINNHRATLSGWIITDEVGRRITDTLAAKIQPIPVSNQLRSISSQQHSVAAARMLNNSFSAGIRFRDKLPELNWDGHVALDKIAKLLRHQTQIRLVIGVHSNGQGDAKKDLYLSQKRAGTIKQRLISLGMKEKNLMAIGYGAKYPMAENLSPVGRALNNRVEFTPM